MERSRRRVPARGRERIPANMQNIRDLEPVYLLNFGRCSMMKGQLDRYQIARIEDQIEDHLLFKPLRLLRLPRTANIATYRKDKNDVFPHPQPSNPRRYYGIPFPPPTNIAETLFNNVPSHMQRKPPRQHDGPRPHTNANVAEPGQDMHVGPYDIQHPRAQFPPNPIDPYSSSYSTPGRRPSTNTFGAQSPGITGNITPRPTPLPSFRESFDEEYEHRYGVPAPTSYPTSNAGLTSRPVLHEEGPTFPTGYHTHTTTFPTGNPSSDPNPGLCFSRRPECSFTFRLFSSNSTWICCHQQSSYPALFVHNRFRHCKQ